MLSTKAKILIFTISSVIATIGLGVGVLAIRDAENRKILDMDDFVESKSLNLSEFFSNSTYELTNYHTFSKKEKYEIEEKNIEIDFLTSDYDLNCNYAVVFVENDEGSFLTSFSLNTQKASIFDKIAYGLDSKKNIISFEKNFSGTCYFTPIAFYNSEQDEGILFKNVKTAKCYIKNYFSLQSISVEKEEIELEQSSYQTVNIEIINAAHKKITDIEIEKDGSFVSFPVEELNYTDKISSFSFFYEENSPGVHEIKMHSLSYETESGEKRNMNVSSEKIRYDAEYSTYIDEVDIQDIVFNKTINFNLSIFNKKTKNIVAIEFVLNDITVTQTLPASYNSVDFCFYYRIPLIPTDFNLMHGSYYKITVTKIILENEWMQIFPKSTSDFLYQEFKIESASIPSSKNGIATLRINLENQIENCSNYKTTIFFVDFPIQVSLNKVSDKILEGTFEIEYEHDFYVTFNSISFECQGTRIAFNFEEITVFCY